MKIKTSEANISLISLIKNPNQIITLDANFLIPPYRKNFTRQSFNFKTYREIWLDPIFSLFPMVAIHEAVLEELVNGDLNRYIEDLVCRKPPKIIIHKDSDLSEIEKILRDSIEEKIYPKTGYDPKLDNKDDRGEVKSLSYIAVKGLLYFASHDNNAIQLIEKSEQWNTGLDNVQAIQMHELIYYLYVKNSVDKKALRMLYKYQYHLTENEKRINPEWGEFIKLMNQLYDNMI